MTEEIIEGLSGTLSEEATERILSKAIVWSSIVSIIWAIVVLCLVLALMYFIGVIAKID